MIHNFKDACTEGYPVTADQQIRAFVIWANLSKRTFQTLKATLNMVAPLETIPRQASPHYRNADALLKKLQKKGCILFENKQYTITEKGRQLLQEIADQKEI